MGNSFSRPPAIHLDAGLTTESIENYYNELAQRRAAEEQANSSEIHDQTGNEDSGSNNGGDDDNNDTQKASDVDPPNETTATTPMSVGSEVPSDASNVPVDEALAKFYGDSAPHIFKADDKDRMNRAIISLTKLGFDINTLGEAVKTWIKAHPWEFAAIVVPLVLLACTPAILGAVGFTAGGIAAGSVAAGIQAGIGSVAAGSAFSILTSAAMGGYGAAIVFGTVWAVPTVCLGVTAAWKRWRGARDRDRDGVAVLQIKDEEGVIEN